jgi:capsular polysaccharide biosynthesis protein
MQLSDYALVLRRRWWAIVLTILVTVITAYIISKLQTPLFRSEATYGLTPSRFDNGLSIVLQNSMNSIRDAALARPQLQKISDDLKIDRSPDWLLKYVAIQPRPDSWQMIVQVDYPQDPAMAQQVANAVGQNMMAIVAEKNKLANDSTDRILMSEQNPAQPAYRYRPQTKLNVGAGAFLGLILGVLLAFLLEALDNTLKGTADIERYVGLTVLGAIPNVEHGRHAHEQARAAPGGWRRALRRLT